MIKEAIIALAKKQDLTYEQAEKVMDEIMSGEASQIQMASYLTALALKGETIDEITASAAAMTWMCWRSWEPVGTDPIPLIFPPRLLW